MKTDLVSAYKMDWGAITPEGYDQQSNEVRMVFNCDIETGDKSDLVVQYVVGRTLWGGINFPSDAKVVLSFDVRGQNIAMERAKLFKEKILSFITDSHVRSQVSIDFLR